VATSNQARDACPPDRRHAASRGFLRASTGWWRWLAIGLAVAIGRAEAWAQPCTAPTPACHLEIGTELLTEDPRRAAEELLASYQLDERTDTLALYATALALDHRYALALDTWKRVIVFRDSELEAAREAVRTATGRKRAAARAAAARAAATRAQKQSEQAAEAIIQLWSRVGRVRIRVAPGQQVAVSRDGAPVDPAQDVIVNAGRDELVFTRRDGSAERVAVQVAAGAFVKIDAPAEPIGNPAAPPVVARALQSREREATARAQPPAVGPAGTVRPAAPAATRADATRPGTSSGASVATSAKSGRPVDAVVATSAKPAAPVAARADGTKPGTPRDAAVVASTQPGRPIDAPMAAAKPAARVDAAVKPDAEGDARLNAAAFAPTPQPAARAVDESRSLTLSRIGLGLVAGAVVAGGVAGSFGYLASRDFDRAREAGCSAGGRCPFGPAADLAQQSNDRARISQISAVGAVALAATGVTLWLVGRGKTHPTVTDVALHVGPSSSSGGLSTAVSGRF
jgi:hypothetical protein